jgi:hypothetical protein
MKTLHLQNICELAAIPTLYLIEIRVQSSRHLNLFLNSANSVHNLTNCFLKLKFNVK